MVPPTPRRHLIMQFENCYRDFVTPAVKGSDFEVDRSYVHEVSNMAMHNNYL
jgi:hypothetical protein